AFARWATVTGVPALTAKDVHIGIADLPDGGPGQLPVIGYTAGTVLIDVHAGGFGWVIDPTPARNSRFVSTDLSGPFTAPAGGPASGRMDLLTVVMHELGHVYGLADLPLGEGGHDLMAMTLVPGERRLPGQGALTAAPNSGGAVGTPTPTLMD